jgi:phosphohistidine phosphatase
MKRTLVLIRHTKSSWADLDMADIDRPLKKDRTDDAINMATKLKQLKLKPDLIICSPAKRTRQTAKYFCEGLGYEYKNVVFNENIYESSAAAILNEIHKIADNVRTLLIIGHNPSLSDLTNKLTPDGGVDLPTTGVAWMESSAEVWDLISAKNCKLLYQLSPKTI